MLISYAQNFEDVILWRALKHVERGFYIDIGAQDPVIDSVSLVFYENEWRGVHVEPTPAYAAKLRSARVDEDVIEAAIARTAGTITLFEIAETGLSTGKHEVARMHTDSGFPSKSIDVVALPLSEVFARYPNRDIHWLKIDVEGMEDDVIASWQPSPARPWVVVIESTVPRSQQPDHSSWEPDLLALGYEFVYFDGLNRFYLHREHEQLRPAFVSSPNVFDDFALSGLANSPFALKLNHDVAGLKSELKMMSDQRQIDFTEIERLRHHTTETDKAYAGERAAFNELVTTLEAHGIEKSAEIGLLHHQIAKTDQAYAAERIVLKEQVKAFETQSQEKDAEIGRLHLHVVERDKAYAAERMVLIQRMTTLETQLREKDTEIERLDVVERILAEQALNAEQQAVVVEQLNHQLVAMRCSISWRLTAPLRSVKRGARFSTNWPRAKLRRALEHALLWLRRQPRAAATAKFLLRYSPWLEQRSLAFSRSRPAKPSADVGGWMLEPDKNTLNEWRKLLRASRTS